MAPNGYEVLQADIRRLFRGDDSSSYSDAQETSPLSEVMQVHVKSVERSSSRRFLSLPGNPAASR